ncbi:hypothetical protein [Flavobacterium sp. Root186]|uniref:hypothetical protein n=1 Tax=Flavobacterium sp. Root186 TaxID=1736485 RepID=UPI0006F4FD38|nr:hypothetical protein [Flavobacterium sp. Root186]KRB55688.1 hypothetical protein ASD98_13620 [Flavobacterium sp. Root186]
MKKILFPLIIIIFISCNNTKNDNVTIVEKNTVVEKQIVVNLKQIAGKKKTEVDKVLGKPDRVEPFSERSTPCKNIPCEKAYYQKDKYEIIFINEKADWITINNLSEYDLNEDNIEIFGLPVTTPEFSNPQDLIRWKDIDGINEINIFNDGSGKISYAYIKVKTE